MIERHYRPAELAQLLGLSEDTIIRYCKLGTLRATRPGGGRFWLIPESAAAEWLRRGEQGSNVQASVSDLRRAV